MSQIQETSNPSAMLSFKTNNNSFSSLQLNSHVNFTAVKNHNAFQLQVLYTIIKNYLERTRIVAHDV